MFRAKNWNSFQSYKDRNPPWIRLHKKLIDDINFQRMSVEARALLPMIWLLISEDEDPVSGMLRIGYEELSFRLRQPEKAIKLAITEMVKAGFLEEINHLNTDSYINDTDPLRICHSETETETETETEYINMGFQKKPSFEDLTIDCIQPWLDQKRACGKYLTIDEYELLEMFKDYCRSKKPKYSDYTAAFRNAFKWKNIPTKGSVAKTVGRS
jgi:hypothetical protein